MAEVQISTDKHEVADKAAQLTFEILNQAVASRGQANWLLSGGTAPMQAYHLLAKGYLDRLDWNKIVVAIGDERCVPLDHPDANWPLIYEALLKVAGLPSEHQLRPASDETPERAAEAYRRVLSDLAVDKAGIPHFDIAWLGMGEDGHTLSLFPGHPAMADSDQLVVPVHDSPKPPPDRISLTLKALTSTDNCLIMALGDGKAEIIKQVFSDDKSLPIQQAVDTIEKSGGKVTWLLDEPAAKLIQ